MESVTRLTIGSPTGQEVRVNIRAVVPLYDNSNAQVENNGGSGVYPEDLIGQGPQAARNEADDGVVMDLAGDSTDSESESQEYADHPGQNAYELDTGVESMSETTGDEFEPIPEVEISPHICYKDPDYLKTPPKASDEKAQKKDGKDEKAQKKRRRRKNRFGRKKAKKTQPKLKVGQPIPVSVSNTLARGQDRITAKPMLTTPTQMVASAVRMSTRSSSKLLKGKDRVNPKKIRKIRFGKARKNQPKVGRSATTSNQTKFECPLSCCSGKTKKLCASSFRYHLRFSKFHEDNRVTAMEALKGKRWERGVRKVRKAAEDAKVAMESKRRKMKSGPMTRSDKRLERRKRFEYLIYYI